MDKLFKLLNIGKMVHVSKTENGRMLICVGTNGVKIFDLEYSNREFIPATSYNDSKVFAHTRYEHEEWNPDTVYEIYRAYVKSQK